MIISLSKPGNSLDNAACETFFSQLKTECPSVLKQKTLEDVTRVVDNYIDYYNYHRIIVKHRSAPYVVYFKNNIKNIQPARVGYKYL